MSDEEEENNQYDNYVPFDPEWGYLQWPDRPGTVTTLEMPIYLYWPAVHTQFPN